MKAYIITLKNISKSKQAAYRCMLSCKLRHIDAQYFWGIWKDDAFKLVEKEGLKVASFDTSFSCFEAVLGCFMSHYLLWKKIVETGEPLIILEHDAVVIYPISDLEGQGDIINLGRPSYGRYSIKEKPGIYPLFSKKNNLPGTHGYFLTPKGASSLIEKAKAFGINPADLFISLSFQNRLEHRLEIKEIFPWPVLAIDDFSSVQNLKGCLQKHQYIKNKDTYQII